MGGVRGDQGCVEQLSSKPLPTLPPPGPLGALRTLLPPFLRCNESGCGGGGGGRSHDSREGSPSLECRKKSSQQTTRAIKNKVSYNLPIPPLVFTNPV